MTISKLVDRKIKVSESKKALCQSDQNEKLKKVGVPAKMIFLIKKEEFLYLKQEGTDY